mgnify:CR=1 FL=1
MKLYYLLLFLVLYFLYFIGLVYQNQILGDILSPIVTLIVFIPTFSGFFLKEANRLLKLAGLFLSLSIFTWFVCDLMWGFSSLILHVDPEANMFIVNGYSFTNLFIIFSLVCSGIFQVKKWNKMQMLLDALMVMMSISLIFWVFVLEKSFDRLEIIASDPVGMWSIISSILIYTWTNIWFFSVRNNESPFFLGFAAAGGVIFALTDVSFYYYYYFLDYEPNSLLDGGYVIAFTLMGIGGYIKAKGYDRKQSNQDEKGQLEMMHFKKELIFLLVPILMLIFEGYQTEASIFTLGMTMFYFLFTNYTQNNIYRDELLDKEKNYVLRLEKEVQERTEEIVKIMNTDVVTGLKNRRFLEEYLEMMTNSLKDGQTIHLLYIEQNKYKTVQSIYGKTIAEKALEELGRRMQKIVQQYNGLLTSYGENYFVVIFKTQETYAYTFAVAEEIVSICSDRYSIEDHDIGITLNIGISSYPSDTTDIDTLIRNADTAMVEAKHVGVNIIRQYDHHIGAYLDQRARIEMMLKKVYFDKEFSLQYQPQVSSIDGRIIGVEALLRWYTPSGEYIPPNIFIPLTEENGMIFSVGRWVLNEAAKQLRLWRDMYGINIRMAINISSKQLMEENFLQELTETLMEYAIPTEYFEIEITENVQLENNTMIKNMLQKIREIGISIAIDDFGTGYSSLHYLKELPVGRIKIAKELIDHISEDIYSRSIVQMVVNVAKVKGIKVIAEGVETKEQWECLKELQCDEIQGYLFSKPLSPSDLEEQWLTSKMSRKDVLV